ncbi:MULTISPECIES: hypothetical protein [Haloferax]|uniref:Uncharacterized protein n=1 Tax=Haloferax marinisediminis TaxID=2666142 RepID=A0A6G1Z120_9EURY|nr:MULTISPECIES: hypothetical protein [Haloferax]MRW80185.1 hypothetical protein [Haloferax marinisediminis]
MSKSIRVSESFHAFIKSHNRDGETMEATLRRLTGHPDLDTTTVRIHSSAD